MKDKVYACIDLKSFYASVECMERNLDPLTTNLVVADSSRTDKTICLAVTPSLKSYGIGGRSRLFEVKTKVKEINALRKRKSPNHQFTKKSYNNEEVKKDPSVALDFAIAKPRMGHYMKYSTKIYNTYLKYLAPEDIYVYSIDEVFCDLTNYLNYYKLSPKELITKMIKDVYESTGITATAGIGGNMYLAKVAMDIVAKHTEANEFGVRIAELDEMSYRKLLWSHEPITDFWRVGKGYATRLEKYNMKTMGDIALCSIQNEDLLYKIFGVNAELLIDHAWGYEPCTMQDIKSYKPTTNSISSGQVLQCAYDYKKTRLVVKEMIELMSLDLVEKNLVTNQLTLTIGYDIDNLTDPIISKLYFGEITTDRYGRKVPKSAHGTGNIDHFTSSSKTLTTSILKLYDTIVNKDLLVRRIYIFANNLVKETDVVIKPKITQFDLFTDIEAEVEQEKKKIADEKEEKQLQTVMLGIKRKYGKNAILKGMNLEEGATSIERNSMIGGHHE